LKRFLLCTDLDRTLIPNGPLPESTSAKELLQRLVNRSDVSLAFVTGRHRALVEQAIIDFDLPQPNYVIADVGTTIYQIKENVWNHWQAWDAQIAPDWHGLAHEDLYRQLSVFPMLRLQEPQKQSRYKLSYYVPPETVTQGLIEDMDKRLKHAGIKANLICSLDEAGGLCLLDVLPASANKLHAIRFLMQEGGFRRETTVFAGDSGNDLDVLLSNIPSVLVANAVAEVKARVAEENIDTIYVAKGDYLGMNGNYRAGILEGVAHYFPEMDVWLRQQQ